MATASSGIQSGLLSGKCRPEITPLQVIIVVVPHTQHVQTSLAIGRRHHVESSSACEAIGFSAPTKWSQFPGASVVQRDRLGAAKKLWINLGRA
jgi:hypothetical protein